ncbi:PREDICTED: glutamate receptor ionotropic, delta-2-like isoform X2 [Wasmannia auropunctata]|uniref:glutamate receptor ionotropic, delta-2-like isoform X2 n=1 Tax=Wasmannia auropunctata TaxID=64793 RepID=UPI0005EFA299|nr:PREDICTED: glutamate receptor ionotropic, delta-2-like isoform X2 [Wasmannia auropunctata]
MNGIKVDAGETKLLLVMLMMIHVAAKPCIYTSPLTLQLLLEYAEWRSWDQVVLFDNVSPFNCALNYARPLIECFGERGISVSLQSATNPNVPDALTIRTHRVGSIVLLDGLNLTSPDNIIQVASQKFLFNYYISWLMVTTRKNDSTIDTVLRDLNIGIDSDVIVATSPLQNDAAAWTYAQKYRNKICRSLQRYGDRFEFEFTGPPEGRNVENATINLSYVTEENRTVSFYLMHTYKIRHSDNASLIVRYLGFWNPDSHTLKLPMSVKLRSDFNGLPIVFGVLNGTSDGQSDVIESDATANDIAPLLDFATIVTHSVNASIELVPHEKLGTLTNKVWSHLLGDVVTGTVDIGLGYITANDEERWAEMTFSHPLIRYMRNIYYHPLETGTMRDIFLQPFDNRLLGCVAGTYLIMLIAMATVIYAAKTMLHDEDEKHVGIGESALWCLSIMCMQGSPWTPRSPSGKTLLLFSLIFSLVMYNAYAGFITSILSVQATGIKSITDLLFNNFKLGYSAADDTYIRNANDSNLRQLYIKAFNNRESRLETRTGLMKAVKGRYGFFVSATLARRALRTTFIQERCTLKELLLPQTLTIVALPMAKSCPYRKIINLNILRIYERGVLDKIQERMLPTMPRCAASAAFHSARLADVYSAFFLLVAGMVTAISIGIFERIWNKRKQMRETVVRSIRRHNLIPHLHFHHHHHHDGAGHNHARQVQSLVGIQERDVSPEMPRGPGLEPRLQVRRRSAGLKRASWASFSGLSKKKIRPTERIPISNAENIRVFPFRD